MYSAVKSNTKLTDVHKALDECVSFLKPYLSLANANASDFILESQWTNILTEDIQRELLLLDEAELCKLPCRVLNGYEKDVRESANNRPTGTNTTGETDFKSSLSLEDDFEAVDCGLIVQNDKQEKTPFAQNEISKQESDFEQNSKIHSDLDSFIKDVVKYSLFGDFHYFLSDRLPRPVDCTETNPGQKNVCLKKGILMSEKKCHEVDLLADRCATLAKHHQCQMIIDVGSGKGYLGTHLASQYSLPTVSVDSCQRNVQSAVERAQRIKKKGARENQHVCSTCSDIMPQLHQDKTDKNCGSLDEKTEYDICKATRSCPIDDNVFDDPPTASKIQGSLPDFFTVSHFVEPYTNLSQLIHDVVPLEQYGFSALPDFLLTGLHTCGDLATSVLQIFSNSPNIRVLCSVGCCYNLLTERPLNMDQDDNQVDYGFPVSSHLKSSSFLLGKGARNLAAQSLHRLAATGMLQGKTFYNRALLEKMLCDFMDVRPCGQISLRNLQKRCKSHYDYMQKAFIKLHLPLTQLTPELMEEYLMRYKEEEFKITAFYQFRALLSPCIEAVILLDRLCFLLEQSYCPFSTV